MKNYKVDFMNKTITVTRNFLKNAEQMGTPEFDTMISLQEKLPSFTIKLTKVYSSKHRHGAYPTYGKILSYLELNNDEEGLKEFETVREFKGYNGVRSWFLKKYPNAFAVGYEYAA